MNKETTEIKFKEMIFLAVIILLGGVLRIYTLADRSLWLDEIQQVNYYFTSDSIWNLFNKAAIHFQTPLDYLIGYSMVSIFGFSEFIVRFPAFLWGSFSLIPIYLLTRYIFYIEVAIISGIFISSSRWMIAYSQEARPYSIFIFFLFLTLYYIVRAVSENKYRDWVLYCITAILLLLTRGYEPIVAIFVIYIITLSIYIIRWPNIEMQYWKNIIVKLTKVNIIITIIYIPFIYLVLKQLLSTKYISGQQNHIYNLWYFLSSIKNYYYTLTFPITHLITLLLLTGFMIIIINRKNCLWRAWFVSMAIFIPFFQLLIYLLLVNMNNAPFATRYMIYWLPFIYIICSYAIAEIGKLITFIFKGKVNYVVVTSLIVLPILVIFSTNTVAYYHTKKDDWRGSSQYIKSIIKPGDIVWVESAIPFGLYGGWQPRFEGKYVYYQDINDLSTDRLIDYIVEHVDAEGCVLLVYIGNIGNKELIKFNRNQVIIQQFTGMNVIKLINPNYLLKDNILDLLEEMQNIYPGNSSSVRIYLAKARLLFAEKKYEDSYKVIRKAKALVQQDQITRFNESVDKYFPGMDSKQIE